MTLYIQIVRIIHSNPRDWKLTIKKMYISNHILVLNHHLIPIYCLINVEKLWKELHSISIYLKSNILTLPSNFDNKFAAESFHWRNIYLLPCKVTLESGMRVFQNKVLINVLYLNKKLFLLGSLLLLCLLYRV